MTAQSDPPPSLGTVVEATTQEPELVASLLGRTGLVAGGSLLRSLSWSFDAGERPISRLRAVFTEWWPPHANGAERFVWILSGEGVAGRLELGPPPGAGGIPPPGIDAGHLGAGLSAGLQPGLAARMEVPVDEGNTTDHLGGGRPLLATPSMLVFMEQTAADLIRPWLLPGFGTVGAHNDIAHSRPAYPGESVEYRATFVGCSGRRLTYYVEARVGSRVVGSGRHENHVVRLGFGRPA